MLKAGEQNEPSLKRDISLFQAVMYGAGLILGAGIYVLIGDVAGIAGNAMWISFAIAAAIAAFTGLSYAELSSMFPKSGAEYVFVKNAFRSNLGAFVAGWLITFVAVASAAAVAIGFSWYLASFFPQFDPLLSAVALVGALSAINFIGIRELMWMNTTFTIIELAGLAIVVAAAVLLGSFAGVDYYEIYRQRRHLFRCPQAQYWTRPASHSLPILGLKIWPTFPKRPRMPARRSRRR